MSDRQKWPLFAPGCKEEPENEEIESQAEKEEELPRTITTCQRCGADDEPPAPEVLESKAFTLHVVH